MKFSYKNKNGRWQTISKVKTYSINEEVLIIKMIDGCIRLLYRNEIKQIRTTKLHEGSGV